MDVTIREAVEHIRLEKLGPQRLGFTFPRLTPEVQSLYRDLRVDLGDLLVFYPEFLDVRTELGLHALFTGFEEGALGLLETNFEICREATSKNSEGSARRFPWQDAENRAYLRSLREYAYALGRIGRHREAICHAREVLRHDPTDHTAAREVLVRSLLHSAQHARVLEITGAPGATSNVQLCLGKVLACVALGWEEEAFYTLAEAYRSWPTTVEVLIWPGRSVICSDALIYPVTEQEQAGRYWLDNGLLWEQNPSAVRFVRRFLGARA
ncbi:MAG TPA: hypothetical protein VF168_04845 [Trueperaceae bacterium]